jgi:hypothetical protein
MMTRGILTLVFALGVLVTLLVLVSILVMKGIMALAFTLGVLVALLMLVPIFVMHFAG